VPHSGRQQRACRRVHPRGCGGLYRTDFLFAVSDNGPPGSGADTSGFADVSPNSIIRRIPAYRRTFLGRVRRRSPCRCSEPSCSRATSRSRRRNQTR
jgi:hypothetical protein